ncbi:hypothetical protein [Azoarcus sp. DN11]|uniref:hypothetical protein n=1 Tax=Azoarcus sp. DN11 TaxID=356837 RepID=UPI000EAE7397|nr:hypothetical protein [Azoarcus sp. DN11]AYH43295.1 hypothetical protein CDA09_07855 [Azoarcus sp. DN11]
MRGTAAGKFVWSLLLVASLSGGVPGAGAAWEPAAISGLSGLTIRVEGEGWGSAERDEIEALLYAVADELTGGSAAGPVDPIVVTHASGSPVTLFDKGREGEYRVSLSARDRGWAQYAYQFGHELCHILSNYEMRAHDPGRRKTQWFEEALCETAGLYVLRSMAQHWRTDAPYPGWDVYAPSLAAYAEHLVAEPHRQLPPGMSVAGWLESKLPGLSADPYRRSDNEVVANLLLPRFEQEPGNWVLLRYLNLAPSAPGSLAGYLAQWRDSAPADRRGFISTLAGTLGLRPPATVAGL